jgi:hypothetical protein
MSRLKHFSPFNVLHVTPDVSPETHADFRMAKYQLLLPDFNQN